MFPGILNLQFEGTEWDTWDSEAHGSPKLDERTVCVKAGQAQTLESSRNSYWEEMFLPNWEPWRQRGTKKVLWRQRNEPPAFRFWEMGWEVAAENISLRIGESCPGVSGCIQELAVPSPRERGHRVSESPNTCWHCRRATQVEGERVC